MTTRSSKCSVSYWHSPLPIIMMRQLTVGTWVVKGGYNDQLKFRWIPILIKNLSIT